MEEDEFDDLITKLKRQREEFIRRNRMSEFDRNMEDALVDELTKSIDKHILEELLNGLGKPKSADFIGMTGKRFGTKPKPKLINKTPFIIKNRNRKKI